MSKASNIDMNQFYILDAISTENYQINPNFTKLTGSITTAFFLTQIMFLFRHYKYKPFYQTDKTMKSRYSFTEWELKSSRKKLIGMGIIKTSRGKGNVLFYEIDIECLITQYQCVSVDKKKSQEETSPRVRRKPPNRSGGNLPTYNNNKQEGYINNDKQGPVVDKPSKTKGARGATLKNIEKGEDPKMSSTHLYIELKSVPNLSDNTIAIILKDWEQFEIINALQACKAKFGLQNEKSARYIMGTLRNIKKEKLKTNA